MEKQGYSISRASTSELLIKKSRFIGCVQPVADRAAAQQVVAGLRSQHPAAAHVCWALPTKVNRMRRVLRVRAQKLSGRRHGGQRIPPIR